MTNIFGNYSIFTNGENEVMVAVLEREGEPLEPCIIYDGGDHAIFYRTPDEAFVLDYIADEVKSLVKEAKGVLMAELPSPDAEEPAKSYFVPVKMVAKLPSIKEALPSLDEIKENPENLNKLAQALVDNGLATLE